MNTYLDNAATTKIDKRVFEAMTPFFNELYGNPSSNNACGRAIRDQIDDSRLTISTFLNCAPNEIIFTSGATESNNLVLKSCEDLCCSENPLHFILSSIEHKSVLNLKEYLENKGHQVDLIECLPSGVVSLEHFNSLIKDNTVLVSCIYVNNETGIIQPIHEISKICEANDIAFHTDATQIVGKMKIDLHELNVDFLSLSAHKFHGPKGVGALYKNNKTELKCQIIGGSQEDGYRSGTENVPGIIGIGKAAEIAAENLEANYSYFCKLEAYFIKMLDAYDLNHQINGDLEAKVPWIFNICFHDILAEDAVEGLQDFCFSKSSACSKGNYPSHVLQAMGLSEDHINRSLRISFSKYTTMDQINSFCKKLKKLIEKNTL